MIMRLAGHVTHTEKMLTVYKSLVRKPKGNRLKAVEWVLKK